nr:hypothetical protein [Micromonospora olivasterospora]
MTDAERQDYWLTVEVPYRAYYAYEETLATFGDVPGSRGLLSAYESLTRHITGGRVTALPRMDEGLRRQTVQRFERKPVIVEELIVLRYVPEDQAWAEWVQAVLTAVDLRVLVAPLDAPAAVPVGAASRELHLVSRAYVAARRELGGPGGAASSARPRSPCTSTTPRRRWTRRRAVGRRCTSAARPPPPSRCGSSSGGRRTVATTRFLPPASRRPSRWCSTPRRATSASRAGSGCCTRCGRN